MIAPMVKAHIAVRRADRDRLLEAVRELGAVHLAPVDPARAVPDEPTALAIDRLERAIQVLGRVKAAPPAPDLSAEEAAARVLHLQRRAAEMHGRLSALHSQVEQMAVWGDVRVEQLDTLRQAGVLPRFLAVPGLLLDQVQGECVAVLGQLPDKRFLVAVVDRSGSPLPEEVEELVLPERDRPSLRAEAAEIDAELKAGADELCRLANLLPAMRLARADRRQEGEFSAAQGGGLGGEDLFAVRGWLPADKAAGLTGVLDSAGVESAVQVAEPADDEQPPTLIRRPRWVRPIEGLFDILGLVPGYRELDLSAAFMVALPVFVAMLISDGGYGLLFLLVPALFYRKVARKMGPRVAQLLMVMGVLAVVWGVITASFFGVGPDQLGRAGGILGDLGAAMGRLQLLRVDTSEESRVTLMRISFIIGVIHLSAAQLWRAMTLFPLPSFLSKVGWAGFLWGMFGVVKKFVLDEPFGWNTPYPYLLIAGGVLAICFAVPRRNLLKMIALGLANFPLSAIGTFSDIMSYVRLMAVGLAGSVLAVSFNQLAMSAHWSLSVPILLCGHGLNIGLCLIALFAHGVRLNVLEFSNNVGMEWSGYPYQPFARRSGQEN